VNVHSFIFSHPTSRAAVAFEPDAPAPQPSETVEKGLREIGVADGW
jgi:hypothetical protein